MAWGPRCDLSGMGTMGCMPCHGPRYQCKYLLFTFLRVSVLALEYLTDPREFSSWVCGRGMCVVF